MVPKVERVRRLRMRGIAAMDMIREAPDARVSPKVIFCLGIGAQISQVLWPLYQRSVRM